MVNVACSYDPVGWGVPYNHVLFGDDQEAVATSALQIVNILLSYSHYNSLSTAEETQNPQNLCVKYLQDLKRNNEFAFILAAFERLVGNPMRAHNTRLPYSMKVVACYQDMLMFMWRLFEENKVGVMLIQILSNLLQRFLMYVIKSPSSPQIFNHLLYFMYSGRKDLTQLGVVQLSTFIFLLLSGERDYCVSLNKAIPPAQARFGILADVPQFSATHADLLVLTAAHMLTDSHPGFVGEIIL